MNENKLPLQSQATGSPEYIDLLAAFPSATSFIERIRKIGLSRELEEKILRTELNLARSCIALPRIDLLTAEDEKELATEVLLRRHRFTELLRSHQVFRQATLTVVQNIYLFRNRKIFFGNTSGPVEAERQEALLLFSSEDSLPIPLGKTLQHLIIARVWNRILGKISKEALENEAFLALHAVVEQLNTLRNIYMLISSGLVRKLAAKTSAVYRESIAYDDAVQIGEIGVARAAYRYHPSIGVRFSTYAASWIFKEIQRQSLEGRLIRISSNTIEKYAKAVKNGDSAELQRYAAIIAGATATPLNPGGTEGCYAAEPFAPSPPITPLEARQRRYVLLQVIERTLSPKSGDIIKRRYGLPPYEGREQSVIAISKAFGVSRSSIYQLEQSALQKLQQALDRDQL